MNQSLRTPLVQIFEPFGHALDWLFPRRCQCCDQKDKNLPTLNLCDFCWNLIFKPQRVIFPNKPDCHVFAAGSYEEFLKRMIIQAKFKHHAISTDTLNELLFRTFKFIPFKVDIITSVPSVYWRSLRRGVDLTATLAFELSKKTGIAYQPKLLRRIRKSDRQTKLSKDKRQSNTQKLFQASALATNQTILVIDDIITTGSTAMACYRALKKQKPAKIIFLTCAKVR